MLLRWRENRAMEESAVRERAEADQRVVEQFGGGELKVLTFYANPPTLKSGSKGLLCYGVANAASVKIAPEVDQIQPSLSRCVEVRPTSKTTYTLTAADDRGRTATRTVDVTVQ
jgi:hypothetical protein